MGEMVDLTPWMVQREEEEEEKMNLLDEIQRKAFTVIKKKREKLTE